MLGFLLIKTEKNTSKNSGCNTTWKTHLDFAQLLLEGEQLRVDGLQVDEGLVAGKLHQLVGRPAEGANYEGKNTDDERSQKSIMT